MDNRIQIEHNENRETTSHNDEDCKNGTTKWYSLTNEQK